MLDFVTMSKYKASKIRNNYGNMQESVMDIDMRSMELNILRHFFLTFLLLYHQRLTEYDTVTI